MEQTNDEINGQEQPVHQYEPFIPDEHEKKEEPEAPKMETPKEAVVPPKQFQKVGMRTFWIYVISNSMPAIVILLIWIALVITKVFGLQKMLGTDPNYLQLINPTLSFALWAGFGLLILSVMIAFLMAVISYYSYQYMLDDNGLLLQRGILNKSETSIPYRQIQDVDMEQSLLDQIFGVARLAILTAGQNDRNSRSEGTPTEGDPSSGAMPLIEKSKAEEIREQLLKRANIEKVVSVTQDVLK